MADRSDLHALLVAVVGDANRVYFQPPPNNQMQYPCIVYRWDRELTKFADNYPYNNVRGYQLTIIDRDPDSEIPGQVGKLPMCTFDRFFPSDNLNHFVYNIFF